MSSCTAGIGFVIENEMKSFFFCFFIADYRFVLPPAAIAADLKPDRR